MKKLSLAGVLSILLVAGGFLLAGGYYSHVEAQSAAEARAELDAGVAAAEANLEPSARPQAAAEPVTTTTTITTTTEPAQPALPPDDDPLVTASEIADDVKGGNWREVAVGALALAMWLLRNQRQRPGSPFKGKRGGAVLAMLMGQGAAFMAVLATDVALTPKLIFGTIGGVWMAVGGYTWLRDILWPEPATAGLVELQS
ncbi:MAG: hypothetical protein M3R63_18515 [Actinomycetota bacterium]|nr:hypothetical protein [Actinomycetota bacterium]